MSRYTYDASTETFKCNACGTILSCNPDRDPDLVKEAHDEVCDQICEAQARADVARENRRRDGWPW